MGRPSVDRATDRPVFEEQRVQESRPARISIHGARNLITVQGEDPNFHYCWVLDHNVDRFLASGYEFVTHPVIIGDKPVNHGEGGQMKISRKAFRHADIWHHLMRVPNEYYKADVEALNSEADFNEDAMKQQLKDKMKELGNYQNNKMVIDRGPKGWSD